MAGLVLGAGVALAMLGKVVDSTAELVRLLRMPGPVASIVEGGAEDGAAWDAMTSPDASVEGQPAASTSEDEAGPLAAMRYGTADGAHPRQPIANSLEISAGRAPDENAGAAVSPARAAVVIGVADASTQAGPKDAAAEAPAKATKEAAAPVRCGQRTCPEGQECCNWTCSICVSPGETCSLSCGSPPLPVSAPCGPNTCNVSEVCCNASCGICVPAGGTCSKKPCEGMYLPVSPTCGMNTCNTGEICCNPSCGICTKPGETCSLEPCIR